MLNAVVTPSDDGAQQEVRAAWERFRAAALHRRVLVERHSPAIIIRAQSRVVDARFADFAAAFAGEAAPTQEDAA